MGIASLIEEMPEEATSVTDSIHCSNNAISGSRSNDVAHASEEVLNLDGQIKISVDSILFVTGYLIPEKATFY
jgi:hypothetical protein